MSDALIPAQTAPYPVEVEVEAGKTHLLSSCGRPAKQCFFDGCHQGTELGPLRCQAEKDGRVFFCGRKASANTPGFDRSH
ncbi:MAG: CDGSH iron-sulfur domain-containing protein [Pseudomonadota bacterium]